VTTYFICTLVRNVFSQPTLHTFRVAQPPNVEPKFVYPRYSGVPANSSQASSGHAGTSGGTANNGVNPPVRNYRCLSNPDSLRSSLKYANLRDHYASWVKVCVLCENASECLSGRQRPMALRERLRWQKNICSRGTHRYILRRQFRILQSPLPRFRCRRKISNVQVHFRFPSRKGRRCHRPRPRKPRSGIHLLQWLPPMDDKRRHNTPQPPHPVTPHFRILLPMN
jgi:hypothetical protein